MESSSREPLVNRFSFSVSPYRTMTNTKETKWESRGEGRDGGETCTAHGLLGLPLPAPRFRSPLSSLSSLEGKPHKSRNTAEFQGRGESPGVQWVFSDCWLNGWTRFISYPNILQPPWFLHLGKSPVSSGSSALRATWALLYIWHPLLNSVVC